MAVAMDFTYRRAGHRPFPEMIEAVERSVRSHGFDVVRSHDLQATLAAKGFEIQPLVVFDIGTSGTPSDLCKMHVYADGESVWVSAMRPLALYQETQSPSAATAGDAEASVVQLVDDACECD